MVCGLWLTQTAPQRALRADAAVVRASAVRDAVAMAAADPARCGIALNDTPVLLGIAAASHAGRPDHADPAPHARPPRRRLRGGPQAPRDALRSTRTSR